MKVSGRLRGMGSAATESIAASAYTAGCNYVIKNNGPYDPFTAVAFATGNSMNYWYIVQALVDKGAGNLVSQVPDAWVASQLSEPIQTSGAGGQADQQGQNINQVNIASAQGEIAGIDTILTAANVLQSARSYANQAFAKVPQAVLNILNGAVVSAPQQSTQPVVTAPPAPPSLILKTTTAPIAATVPIENLPMNTSTGQATNDVTTAIVTPTPVLSSSPNWMLWGAAAAAAYFLLRK
jgi:hypothetical protein